MERMRLVQLIQWDDVSREVRTVFDADFGPWAWPCGFTPKFCERKCHKQKPQQLLSQTMV